MQRKCQHEDYKGERDCSDPVMYGNEDDGYWCEGHYWGAVGPYRSFSSPFEVNSGT